MGYRSDVAIVMKQAVEPYFRKACEDVAAEPQASFNSPFDQDADQRLESEGDVLYVWSSVKAYDWDRIMSTFRDAVELALQEGGSLTSELPTECTTTEDCYSAIFLGEEMTEAERSGGYSDNIFSLSWNKEITYKRPITDSKEVVLKDDDEARYVLPTGEFIWICAGNTSIRLKHHSNGDIETVIYPLGRETDPSLAEAYVFGQDAKEAISEAEAEEAANA